jgi:hypothetical protein
MTRNPGWEQKKGKNLTESSFIVLLRYRILAASKSEFNDETTQSDEKEAGARFQ